MSDKKRQEQLKSALRANLRKRKVQARAREKEDGDEVKARDMTAENTSTLSNGRKSV